MEKSKIIFGNPISPKVYQKALRAKKKHIKKYGDDSNLVYPLSAIKNPTLGPILGIENIILSADHSAIDKDKGIIIGNIRMGYGHYRISMAIASAAHAMGYTPYWFDLNSYKETTGGKVIDHLNSLYSMGSRWSQKYPLFNRFYWERLNSQGFKKLSYNAMDQKVAELMTSVYKELPKTIPFVATHVWPAQAAVHAKMKKVINVIPDNWPMALHLAEGSIHTVQTPSSFLGYKTLKGMDGDQTLHPMTDGQLHEVGHYIDHELVVNIEEDCAKRMHRISMKQTKRILLTIGGAGAQQEIFSKIILGLLPRVNNKEVALYINVGDHKDVWHGLCKEIPQLLENTQLYFDDWGKTVDFAKHSLENNLSGIYAFYHEDIFAAVYSSNLLMRSCDILITKPSELSFYPVPKLLIKRVGGHEAWGAVRSAEVGDGTIECETDEQTLQMLDLMLDGDEILMMLSNNILKAYKIGIYHGAYKVIQLATKAD